MFERHLKRMSMLTALRPIDRGVRDPVEDGPRDGATAAERDKKDNLKILAPCRFHNGQWDQVPLV
jgi:hypothetical protein